VIGAIPSPSDGAIHLAAANPTERIRVGEHGYRVIQPLRPVGSATRSPPPRRRAARLVLPLAAVHAARTGAIRALLIDDVDVGNRLLVIVGRIRRLNELTRQILGGWLDHRRTRWPHTVDRDLIVTQQTALEANPPGRTFHAGFHVGDAGRRLFR